MNDKNTPPTGPSALLLGTVGLALMVGGWQVSRWTPPREPGLIDELRQMAGQELRDKIDGYDRFERPFELPGRLAFFIGVGLFALAGVKMWRAPAPTADDVTAPATHPPS